MVHGRCKGSSSCVFRFMAVYMAKKVEKRQKGTKGESQKEEVRRKTRTVRRPCQDKLHAAIKVKTRAN